jgi:hypothetical protein
MKESDLSQIRNTKNFIKLRHIRNFQRSSLTVILLILSTVLSAQWKPGYIFGINLSTITIKTKGINSKPETAVGYHFGFYYDILLNKHTSVQSGFILSSKGTDYFIDTVRHSLAPTYFEIPLNFTFHLGLKATNISLYAGPYSAFAIGGYEIVDGDPLKYLKFGASKKNDLTRFDFGFNIGLGVYIKSYIISAQYGIGLTDLTPANDSDVKNEVIGISIIYLK